MEFSEIGQAISWLFGTSPLCSEQAGYMTCNWIEVDGGMHRSAF